MTRTKQFDERRTYRLWTECDQIIKSLADGYPFNGADSPALRYIILDWYRMTKGTLGALSTSELLEYYKLHNKLEA